MLTYSTPNCCANCKSSSVASCEICNEIFAPTTAETEHARELIAVYNDAARRGLGTIDFKGQMIDGPLLKRAEAVLELARQIEARG